MRTSSGLPRRQRFSARTSTRPLVLRSTSMAPLMFLIMMRRPEGMVPDQVNASSRCESRSRSCAMAGAASVAVSSSAVAEERSAVRIQQRRESMVDS